MLEKPLAFKCLMIALVLLPGWLTSGYAAAAGLDCKVPYTIVSGDTLSGIAQRAYGNHGKYNLIFYANKAVLKDGPAVVRVGQQLRIPCPEAEAPVKTEVSQNQTVTAPAASATSQSQAVTAAVQNQTTRNQATTAPAQNQAGQARLNVATIATPARRARRTELLTAGGYVPFTDKGLVGGGLVTELLETSLKSVGMPFRTNWIEDWSAHLDPLLAEKKYDVGFPWYDPGCPGADSPRCEFLFSKPVFELLIVLFVKAEKPLKFRQDNDLLGSTLCRSAGYFTHDLDNNGRNWLKDGKVTLAQPRIVKECFDLLMENKVDAVAINDFTGREYIAKLGLSDKVIPLERELSVEGLHALVHKTHPRATILINRINAGLAAIHDSGQYDEIMDRHLLNHWKSIESVQ